MSKTFYPNRRDFLRTGAVVAGACFALPTLIPRTGWPPLINQAPTTASASAASASGGDHNNSCRKCPRRADLSR